MKFNAKPLFVTNCAAPTVHFNKAMIKLQELDRAAYRMQIVTDVIWTTMVKTAATCGFYTYFNPEFYVDFCENVHQRCFLHAHEIKHIWLRHPQRGKRFQDRGYFAKDVPFIHRVYNTAADIVINADNVAMGMEPISGVIFDDRFNRNSNVDAVYMTLIKEWMEEQDKEQEQEQQDSDDMSEESSDAADESEDQESGSESGDDSEDESGDSGNESGDEESGDESGDDAGDTGEEGDDESESESSGESGDESDDESDETGTGSGSDEDGSEDDSEASDEGEPQATDHDGHDEHFQPQYDGDENEQAEAADQDEKRIERNVDDAIEDFQNYGSEKQMGGGFQTAGYRFNDPQDPSGINWKERLADVMTRPGTGGPANWGKINRRKLMTTGVVTPTRKGSIDRLVITDDISSSVDDDQWRLFLTEFAAIADVLQPANGTLVLWTNTRVVSTDIAMSGQELLALEAPRGGGNRLCAGCEWLYENGVTYDLHIAFTDGWTPLEDYQRWAQDGVLVVIDSMPDQWVMDMLKETGCEYVIMNN